MKAKNNIMIYVTSWRRYNEGGEGYCVELDGIKDYYDIINELKQAGFDLKNYDEELTIHDYIDGELIDWLYNRHGESFGESVIEEINQIINLDDCEKI